MSYYRQSQIHLLGAASLNADEILFFFKVAEQFAKAITNHEDISLLKNKTIVNLFFEDSTRTRTSFELAARKLGANTLNFSTSSSSLAKGETLLDTARNIVAMGPQCFVVRHSSAGTPAFLAAELENVSIVNAGDGFHEHPTQALLDSYTIREKLGSIKGKRVVILGDIAHSRVARSNIHVLIKLGASVAVCAPPTLLPPDPKILGVDFAYRPEALLRDADIVMVLRIQLERQNKMQFPSIAEYSRFWGLNKERAKLLKPNVIILHPGPINRGVELDPEVADGPHSVILEQVFNGVLIRMAVLSKVCNLEALQLWLSNRRAL